MVRMGLRSSRGRRETKGRCRVITSTLSTTVYCSTCLAADRPKEYRGTNAIGVKWWSRRCRGKHRVRRRRASPRKHGVMNKISAAHGWTFTASHTALTLKRTITTTVRKMVLVSRLYTGNTTTSLSAFKKRDSVELSVRCWSVGMDAREAFRTWVLRTHTHASAHAYTHTRIHIGFPTSLTRRATGSVSHGVGLSARSRPHS